MGNFKHRFLEFKNQLIGIKRIEKGQYKLKRNFCFDNNRGIVEPRPLGLNESMVLVVSVFPC